MCAKTIVFQKFFLKFFVVKSTLSKTCFEMFCKIKKLKSYIFRILSNLPNQFDALSQVKIFAECKKATIVFLSLALKLAPNFLQDAKTYYFSFKMQNCLKRFEKLKSCQM